MTQLSYWVRGLICLGLLVLSRTGWSEESLRIRILCYNIHHAEGVDRKLDLNRIGKLIKTVNPDVVALQEVDQNVRRTRNVNQPKVLSEITGLDVVFGKNIPLQDGHYGNVLLSRFEIQHYKNHQLPNFEQGEQRGVIEATLKLPGGWERFASWQRIWIIGGMKRNDLHRPRRFGKSRKRGWTNQQSWQEILMRRLIVRH